MKNNAEINHQQKKNFFNYHYHLAFPYLERLGVKMDLNYVSKRVFNNIIFK